MIREKAPATVFGEEFTLALREIEQSADTPRTRAIMNAVLENWIKTQLRSESGKFGEFIQYYAGAVNNLGSADPKFSRRTTAYNNKVPFSEPADASTEADLYSLMSKTLPNAQGWNAFDSVLSRGHSMAQAIMARPDMLSADDIAERMQLARSTVYDYIKRQLLLAVKVGKSVRLPDWQIDEAGQPFASMPELLKRAHGNAWDLYRVLTACKPDDDMPYGVQLMVKRQTEELFEYIDTALPE